MRVGASAVSADEYGLRAEVPTNAAEGADLPLNDEAPFVRLNSALSRAV